VRSTQRQLQALKATAASMRASGENSTVAAEVAEVERQIQHLATVLWAQEDYPEIDIQVGKRSYRYNAPGTNEERCQVTWRDFEKAVDRLPPPPPAAAARVPNDF